MRKSLLAGAVLASVSLITPSAHAANSANVTGTGTISPGLPVTGCANQSVSFSGTAVVYAGTFQGQTFNFTFNGSSSICETLQAGQGSGTISGDLTSTDITYTRTGSSVAVSGHVSFGGSTETITNGSCTFIPTSANPTNSYVLHCSTDTA